MKKLKSIIAFAIVAIISSCSKDDVAPTPAPTNFDEIKLADIQNRSSLMTGTKIKSSDFIGLLWQKGAVYIFKTSEGDFGKFEVVSIEKEYNYGLTVNITVYNSNGTPKGGALKGLFIRGTYACNLDLPDDEDFGLQSDFLWNRQTEFDTYLVPSNGAVFLKYEF